MCGIFGIVGIPFNAVELTGSITAIRHRGPDAESISIESTSRGQLALGHTRLSIIDLSYASNQPMVSACGKYVIVFNGEIYNYESIRTELIKDGFVFNTSSDTEVLLNLYIKYRERCVEYLNGMFAFVIFDKNEDELFMCRDPLGKKPLYLYKDDNGIAFSSETTGLLAFNSIKRRLSIDSKLFHNLLSYGFIPGTRTVFKQISKLAPGSWMKYSISRAKIYCNTVYWDPKMVEPNNAIITQSEVENLISQSVKLRLKSDANSCVFLSGGIDSSLIYSEVLKFIPEIVAHTISFPEYKSDESHFAVEIAKKLGGHCSVIEMESSDFVNETKLMLQSLDEPIADAAMIPLRFLSKSVSNKAKVAFSGDGGDEVFGGYIKYRIQHLVEGLPRFGRIAIGDMFSNSKNENLRRLAIGMKCTFESRQYIYGSGGLYPNQARGILASSEYFDSNSLIHSQLVDYCTSPRVKSMYLDLKFQLPDWYLYKADRASMAYGVEIRSPLLDTNLIKYIYSRIFHHDSNMIKNKLVLKKILAKRVPKHLVYRKKMGFSVNLGLFTNSKDATTIAYADTRSNYIDSNWLDANYKKLTDLQKFKIIVLNSYLSKNGLL